MLWFIFWKTSKLTQIYYLRFETLIYLVKQNFLFFFIHFKTMRLAFSEIVQKKKLLNLLLLSTQMYNSVIKKVIVRITENNCRWESSHICSCLLQHNGIVGYYLCINYLLHAHYGLDSECNEECIGFNTMCVFFPQWNHVISSMMLHLLISILFCGSSWWSHGLWDVSKKNFQN